MHACINFRFCCLFCFVFSLSVHTLSLETPWTLHLRRALRNLPSFFHFHAFQSFLVLHFPKGELKIIFLSEIWQFLHFIIMPSLDLCLDTGGRVQMQHRMGKKELKVFGPYILEAIQQFMKIYCC